MARIYANENFPKPAVEKLRELGHDVLTVLEVGVANLAIPDEEVLAFATEQSRVVLTLNRRISSACMVKIPVTLGLSSAHSTLIFSARLSAFIPPFKLKVIWPGV